MRARSLYANLRFCERLGLRVYRLAGSQDYWVGDWVFSPAAFPDFRPDPETYLQRYLAYANWSQFGFSRREVPRLLLATREQAAMLVDELAQEIAASGARIVGCTSTYQSHVASLAILRRVKELAPEVVTLLGGANCESEMGQATHRYFPWVDLVVSGEADQIIAPLCRTVLERGAQELGPDDIPPAVFAPVHRRLGYPSQGGEVPRATVEDLSQLPPPDYHDYFQELSRCEFLAECTSPGLPLEASRGCWWGQRHPCNFCSLNGPANRYRVKPAQQVKEEIRTLVQRHGVTRFSLVDNIMAPAHFKTLFPALAEMDPPVSLFCETSASLNREQLRLLREGGFSFCQAGLESLHSRALRALNKGTQAWLNLRFLKNSLELGINVIWVLLFDFPGEEDEWYREMAELVPAIHHLQPPVYLNVVQFARFSAYHTRARSFGLDLRPKSCFSHIYPLDQEQLAELVWDFDEKERQGTKLNLKPEMSRKPGVRRLCQEIITWNDLFNSPSRPRLEVRREDETLVIEDTRPLAGKKEYRLRGLERRICLLSDQGVSRARLYERLADEGHQAQEVDQVLAGLRDKSLVLKIDDHYLFLAVPPSRFQLEGVSQFPPGTVDRRLYEALVLVSGRARGLDGGKPW